MDSKVVAHWEKKHSPFLQTLEISPSQTRKNGSVAVERDKSSPRLTTDGRKMSRSFSAEIYYYFWSHIASDSFTLSQCWAREKYVDQYWQDHGRTWTGPCQSMSHKKPIPSNLLLNFRAKSLYSPPGEFSRKVWAPDHAKTSPMGGATWLSILVISLYITVLSEKNA